MQQAKITIDNNMCCIAGVEMGEEESGDMAPITQIDLEPLVRNYKTFSYETVCHVKKI